MIAYEKNGKLAVMLGTNLLDGENGYFRVPTPEGIAEYMAETGCSESEAQAHAYESPTRVAYREGSNINEEEYMDYESLCRRNVF